MFWCLCSSTEPPPPVTPGMPSLDPPSSRHDANRHEVSVSKKVVLPLSQTVIRGESVQLKLKAQRKEMKQQTLLKNKQYLSCSNLTLSQELKRRKLRSSGNKKTMADRLKEDDSNSIDLSGLYSFVLFKIQVP